jgi:hypothetical protein
MKIIRNWLRRQLEQSQEECIDSIYATTLASSASVRSTNSIDSQGVQFTLHKAVGGHVVELRDYDRKTDRSSNSLHIIPNDADFGEALNHIITYEALKR